MQGLCKGSGGKKSHPAGLCKECKDGNHPREEMKKQFLMVLSKIVSRRLEKRLHSLQILAKVTSKLDLSI
jgi:hypothetical protein